MEAWGTRGDVFNWRGETDLYTKKMVHMIRVNLRWLEGLDGTRGRKWFLWFLRNSSNQRKLLKRNISNSTNPSVSVTQICFALNFSYYLVSFYLQYKLYCNFFNVIQILLKCCILIFGGSLLILSPCAFISPHILFLGKWQRIHIPSIHSSLFLLLSSSFRSSFWTSLFPEYL